MLLEFLSCDYTHSVTTHTHSPVSSVKWACPGCESDRRVRPSQEGALLRVRGVQPSDVGSYTCIVVGVGNYTASLTIRSRFSKH